METADALDDGHERLVCGCEDGSVHVLLLLGQRRQPPSLSCDAADLQQLAREPVATVNEDQKDGAGRRAGDSSLATGAFPYNP